MSIKESFVLMTYDYITTVFYIVSRYIVGFRGNGASLLRLRSYWQSVLPNLFHASNGICFHSRVTNVICRDPEDNFRTKPEEKKLSLRWTRK